MGPGVFSINFAGKRSPAKKHNNRDTTKATKEKTPDPFGSSAKWYLL